MHSKGFGRPWQQKDQIQGFVFDSAMILANFILLGSMSSTPIEDWSDFRIGVWLGMGILAQFTGARLKMAPLQQRINFFETDQSENRENFLGCLTFIHFLFFLIAIAMTLALLGFINLEESGGFREFVWVFISFIASAVISGTVWLAMSPPGSDKVPDIRWRYQEVIANVLLWISATILTRFFWNAILFESGPPTYMGFSLRAIVLIAAASALFMVFYVPARLLFLAEDYKYPMTWIRLWFVAMLPLLSIVLLGRSLPFLP